MEFPRSNLDSCNPAFCRILSMTGNCLHCSSLLEPNGQQRLIEALSFRDSMVEMRE